MKLIILIGQRVRSGTNFIGSTLSQHPEVQTIPPGKSHGEFNLFSDRSIVDAIENITNKSFGIKYNENDDVEFYRKFGELCINQLIKKYDLSTSHPIFIKSPIINNYDLWLKAFPDAKFIFLCRDGRDNVISSVKASNDKRSWHNFSTKLKKRLNYYTGRSYLAHIKSWKKTASIFNNIHSSEKLFKIKYEDLISSYENLEKLLNFLELESSQSVLSKCLNAPVVGSSFGDTQGKISRSNWKPEHDKSNFVFTEKWKKWGWIKRQVFKKLAGEQLIDLRYEQDNNW